MCLIRQDANLLFALYSCVQFGLLMLSCYTLQPCVILYWALYGQRGSVYRVCIHKQRATDGLQQQQ